MKWKIILTIAALLIVQWAEAAHLAGADINYRALGNGQYEVTIRVYRNCDGVQISQVPVTVRCLNNNGSLSFSPSRIAVRDISGIGQGCNLVSNCSGGTNNFFGIEEHTFQGVINLSNLNCCEVEFGYQQSGGRPSAFTTGMADQGLYVSAFLNKCIQPANNSPQFTNPPVALIARGQDYVFNLGAFDTIDKDEFYTYKLERPLQSRGNPVSYNNQFNQDRPLTFLGFPDNNAALPSGFYLHPMLGNLEFRPTRANESGAHVIEVTEWRKTQSGVVKVGQVSRDIGLFVVDYGNNRVPVLSRSDTNYACVGRKFCLDITSSDGNGNDTVRLSAINPIKGSTFSNNNNSVRLASGQFCWTPTESDLRDEPYIFTVTATDNGCPINGRAVRAYSVFVGLAPSAAIKIDTLSCGRIVVDYLPDSLTATFKDLEIEWLVLDSTGRKRFQRFKKSDTLQGMGGMNIVKMRLKAPSQCVDEKTDTIYFSHLPQVRLTNDTLLCAGYRLEISAQSSGGFAPYTYRWSTGVNDTGTKVSVVPRQDTAFWVELSDQSRCIFRDSVSVSTKPSPAIELGGPYAICTGDTLFLNVNAGENALFWSNGGRDSAAFFTTTGHIWLHAQNLQACESRDSTFLTVNPLPVVNLGPDPVSCDGNPVLLQSNIPGKSYRWSTGDTSSSITVNIPGIYSLLLTDSNHCSNTDEVSLRFGLSPQVNLGTDGILCHGETKLLTAGAPGMPHTYRWNDSDTRRVKPVSRGGLYSVTVTDTAGCAAKDSISLYDFKVNYTLSNDTAVMQDAPLTMTATGAMNVEWRDAANPQTPLTTGFTYSFNAEKPLLLLVKLSSDSLGSTCSVNDSIRVQVNVRPEIITEQITRVCAGSGLCIPIKTEDLNAGDRVILRLLQGPSGAVFNILNPGNRLPEAELCWSTPVIAGMDSLVQLVIEAEDNGLPLPQIVQKQMAIKITAPHTNATGITRPECNFFQLSWQTNIPMDSISSAIWEIKNQTQQPVAILRNNPDTITLPRGFYEATLTTISKGNCIVESKEQLESMCDGVGLSRAISGEIRIHPNPAHQQFYIEIPGFVCDSEGLKLLDFSGRQLSIAIEQSDAGKFRVKSSELAAGVYLVQATCDGRLYQAKVVVER